MLRTPCWVKKVFQSLVHHWPPCSLDVDLYPNPQKPIIFDIFVSPSWLLKSSFLLVERPGEKPWIFHHHHPPSCILAKVYESDNALSLVMECMEGTLGGSGSGRFPKTKGFVPQIAADLRRLLPFSIGCWCLNLASSQIRCCLLRGCSCLLLWLHYLRAEWPNLWSQVSRIPAVLWNGIWGLCLCNSFEWRISSTLNVLIDYRDISILNYVSPDKMFVNG